MPTDNDPNEIAEAARHLVKITQTAWEYAAAKDFERLGEAIQRRDEIVKVLRSKGDLAALPPRVRTEVTSSLERTQEIDARIRNVLENEMASDSQAMADAATKSRALSAYDRIVPRARRFDTHK